MTAPRGPGRPKSLPGKDFESTSVRLSKAHRETFRKRGGNKYLRLVLDTPVPDSHRVAK